MNILLKKNDYLNELFKDKIGFLNNDSLYFRNNVLGLFITKIKKQCLWSELIEVII